jgi:hypothetical protein
MYGIQPNMTYFHLLMSHNESPDQTIISVAVLFIAEHAIFLRTTLAVEGL